MRTALAALLAVLVLALLGVVGAAARDHRPAPFGDAVAVRSTGSALLSAEGPTATGTLRLGAGGSVLLPFAAGGAPAWSYRRPGHHPVRLFPLADGTTVAVWDDGLLTGIRPDGTDGPRVSWHRSVPGLADWLHRPRAARGLLLAPLDGGRAFLLLTPQLVMTYTSADGSIRTDALPPPGCAYDPTRALVLPGPGTDLVVVARPCPRRLSSVEAFGRDGRRWQAPAGPLARPVPAGPGAVGVLDAPHRRPRILARATGRAPRPTVPGIQRPDPR